MIDQHVNESQKGAICHQGRRPGQRGAVSLSHSAPISDGPVVEPAEDNCESKPPGSRALVTTPECDPPAWIRLASLAGWLPRMAGVQQARASGLPVDWQPGSPVLDTKCRQLHSHGRLACPYSRGAVTGRIVSIQLSWHTKYVSCNIKLSNLFTAYSRPASTELTHTARRLNPETTSIWDQELLSCCILLTPRDVSRVSCVERWTMGFPSSVVLGLGAAPVPVTAMTFWPVERAVAKPSFAADMANLPLCAVRAFCRDVRAAPSN